MKKIYLYESATGKQGSKSNVKLSDYFVLVDDDDYERVNQHKWFLMKLYHCGNDKMYARRYEGKTSDGTYKAILMHRFILDEFDRKVKIDHINHNGLDNTKLNLRKCTHSENLQNSRSLAKNKKYTGVYKKPNGLYSIVLRNNEGAPMWIHDFNNERVAAQVRNVLKMIHSDGKSVRLNKIDYA